MSTVPANKIECNRGNPDGRNPECHDGEVVCCFAVGGGT